jgi:hypothetical protein
MKTTALLARGALFFCLFAAGAPALAQTASLSFAEGKVLLLRGIATYSMDAGTKLETGDMIETAAKGQAQVEFADGLTLNLGPQSKLYLMNVAADPAKPAQIALASGWLKAAARKGAARELQYMLPGLRVDTKDAIVVLHATSPADEVFVESGAATVEQTAPDGSADKASSLAVKGGDYVSRKEGVAAAVAKPPSGFFGSVPRHYMDNLPALYPKVKELQREALREHDTTYAEAEAWLKSNKLVRQGLVLRYQARAKDPEFRNALLANMSAHPEWERVVGTAKKK